MGMTYVKADEIAPAEGATAAVVVNLGLGIDEAARILGVLFNVTSVGILVGGTAPSCYGAYSFDPEDTTPDPKDDEQFASCFVFHSATPATYGGAKQSESTCLDFSGMNLTTTRNLALVGRATLLGGSVEGKVYYERFKPSAIELSQLIATRR
ncbi:hypothetical protein ES708_33003 [subsurface metagenome]